MVAETIIFCETGCQVPDISVGSDCHGVDFMKQPLESLWVRKYETTTTRKPGD